MAHVEDPGTARMFALTHPPARPPTCTWALFRPRARQETQLGDAANAHSCGVSEATDKAIFPPPARNPLMPKASRRREARQALRSMTSGLIGGSNS